MIDKIYGMLGFARRSGKLFLGFDSVLEGISNNKIKLVIIAQDASIKNSQKIQKNCQMNDIDYIEYGDKLSFGQLLNKSEVSFIGLKDKHMAEYIRNLY
ncbi:MAG: ribosomal L7Ae/L30e/S12e/Gadd45 family protein [Tissierellales bacterium]|nr:ribosomal L7Ae/L30e/S12e/Gadd45 family protein [Tissierellales bacterium]MBN2827955.1 ribosomal L7Ae/L30e/S12e/Gadd45 family protein [Tissierellales bacterium]